MRIWYLDAVDNKSVLYSFFQRFFIDHDFCLWFLVFLGDIFFVLDHYWSRCTLQCKLLMIEFKRFQIILQHLIDNIIFRVLFFLFKFLQLLFFFQDHLIKLCLIQFLFQVQNFCTQSRLLQLYISYIVSDRVQLLCFFCVCHDLFTKK